MVWANVAGAAPVVEPAPASPVLPVPQASSPQASSPPLTDAAAGPSIGTVGIVALPTEVPGVTREALGAALQRGLRRHGGTAVTVEPSLVRTSLRRWLDGAATVSSNTVLARLRQEAAQSWRAYLSVSLDTAATGLSTVVRAALPLIVTAAGRELFVDALLRLGIVMLQRSDISADAKQGAQDGMALALRLDPDRTLSLSEFSPDVVALVDATRAAPVEIAELRVRSAVAVRLTLDGRDLGALPARATRSWPVARGVHVLIVADGVRRPQPRLLDVGRNGALLDLLPESDAVAETLRRDATRYTSGRDANDLLQGLAMIGSASEAVLVVATWKRGGPALQAQRCLFRSLAVTPVLPGNEPFFCNPPAEVGWDGSVQRLDAAIDELVRTLYQAATPTTAATIAIVTEPSARPPTVATPCQWCRNKWVWAGVGTALVAGAATAYLLTRSSDPIAPIIVVTPGDF
ncbi:MAG: hypothetical protein KBG15_18765 [Kofleriaceae bacterium]|nr:hypothetical protein [Kofleriaceae bacterium]